MVGSDDKPVKLVESVLDNGLLQLGEQRIAAEPSEEMANFVVEYIAKNNRTRLMGRTNIDGSLLAKLIANCRDLRANQVRNLGNSVMKIWKRGLPSISRQSV